MILVLSILAVVYLSTGLAFAAGYAVSLLWNGWTTLNEELTAVVFLLFFWPLLFVIDDAPERWRVFDESRWP